MALVTVKMPLPSNFGRVVRHGNRGRANRRGARRDARRAAIDEMNAGIYAFDEDDAARWVTRLRNDNAQGEYYLTDTVARFVGAGKPRARRSGRRITSSCSASTIASELARARKEMNARLCAHHMRDGVTIVDPETTYLEPELDDRRRHRIYPNTTIARLSRVGRRLRDRPEQPALERAPRRGVDDARERRRRRASATACRSAVRASARRGTHRRRACTIGNFVEIKKSSARDAA